MTTDMTTDTNYTLATPRNMRQFESEHPGRDLPGGGHVEGLRCFAYSPVTHEQFSASAGDYWTLSDDEPLKDSEGYAMILAVSETRYSDALTGELI